MISRKCSIYPSCPQLSRSLVGDESRTCSSSSKQQQLQGSGILLSDTLSAPTHFNTFYSMAFVVSLSYEFCPSNLLYTPQHNCTSYFFQIFSFQTFHQRLDLRECTTCACTARPDVLHIITYVRALSLAVVKINNSAALLEAEYLLIKYFNFPRTQKRHRGC